MNTRMSAKEERMNKLAEAGIDTGNFFDLSMRIPFGAEVKIVVDGKEMVVPAQNTETNNANNICNPNAFVMYGRNVEILNGDLVDSETGEVILKGNDPIAKDIIENGYVKNSKLFRRFVFAHTMKMLNYQSYRDPSRKGWEACMKDRYDYNYQFTMLLEEIRVLSILQREDLAAFEERTHFFNGDVVVKTLKDYQNRLRKYIEKCRKERKRMYKNKEYVKLAKYDMVFVTDLTNKVYKPIEEQIKKIEYATKSGNYKRIYEELKLFMNDLYNKLPHDTTKCMEWKDAFKGIGGFESLKNGIRFHNLVIKGCTGKYDSERKLYELLNNDYKNEVWRFHQLLVETIEFNNFDLRRSIAEGHNAKGTTSYLHRR